MTELRKTLTIAALAIMVLITISILLMVRRVETHGVDIGLTMLAIIIAYLIFSFGTVKQSEVGMISIFDRPIGNLRKGFGLYFAPFLIVSVKKEFSKIFQDELPCQPEDIFRGDGPVPPGKFPPIRIKFGPPPTNPVDQIDIDLARDPYNVEMVAEAVPVVAWWISDPTIFFGAVGDTDNCRKMLADRVVKTFGEDLGKMTPAKATMKMRELSALMLEELKKETKDWGITLEGAYLKPFIFSHGLNEEVENVSKAGQKKKATILLAEGKKEETIQLATGVAEGVKLTADAERMRLLKTGQAKETDGGNIVLIPDARTKAQTDAMAKLAEVKGTLVLGEATSMIGIGKNHKE